jgi:hypothetical protein
MVVCDEVCVWVVEGFPDDEEGSLRVLLEAVNCMAAATAAVEVVVLVAVVVVRVVAVVVVVI